MLIHPVLPAEKPFLQLLALALSSCQHCILASFNGIGRVGGSRVYRLGVVGVQVRIGPTVAEHDLQVKLKQARGFVEKNYRVKLFVPYRMQQRQDAFVMLGRLRELGSEFAAVANPAENERLARNTFAIFLSPK